MRIVNIPIENLEERYSTQWNYWFPSEFERLGVDFINVYGEILTSRIEHGSFLDVCGTNYFKMSQLQKLVSLIYQEKVSDEDVFFFHDLWFPGMEALAYIRDGLSANFRIFGCLHAGTYDPYDFLSKKGMTKWGRKLEESWFEFVDGIFVATHFHKKLLVQARCVDPDKIYVTGFPIYWNDSEFASIRKENIVVFPHRLDSEKNPHLFDFLCVKLKPLFPEWKFIKTKDVCVDKKDYYNLLASSKIAVSFADQETWGIAMQEAVFADCIPVVPNRLSYVEMYLPCFRFDCVDRALVMVKHFICHSNRLNSLLFGNKQRLLNAGGEAIRNMIEVMIRLERQDG